MPNYPQRIIGLTGGIGTGKSTVARYLAQNHDLPILDADLYAREAVEPDSPILKDILARYSDKVRASDGTLNRKALGEIIFQQEEEKAWLEAKIHPYVGDRFRQELAAIEAQTVILVIPLLFEAEMTDLVTEIWVVTCAFEQQIDRIQKRDRLSRQQAITRIDSQFPLARKVAAANTVLDNSSSLTNLEQQIDAALISNSEFR